MINLDSLGKLLGVEACLKNNSFLGHYETHLSEKINGFTAAFVNSPEPVAMSRVIKSFYPNSQVVFFSKDKEFINAGGGEDDNIVYYSDYNDLKKIINSRYGVFDYIVECEKENYKNKLLMFKELFWYLKGEGIYFCEHFNSGVDIGNEKNNPFDNIYDFIHKVIPIESLNPIGKEKFNSFEIGFSKSIQRTILEKGLLGVHKRKGSYVAVRPENIPGLIDLEVIKGRVISYNDKIKSFNAQNLSKGSDAHLLERHKREFVLPPEYIYEVSNVTCIPGQVCLKEHYLLPDTFRMQNVKYLHNKNVARDNADFFHLDFTVKGSIVQGDFFYFDSEFPCHFGHFTSELVSRLWSWKGLKDRIPQLKLILSIGDKKELPSFAKSILLSFGILESDVYIFNKPTIFENVIFSSQHYEIGSHIKPNIVDVWNEIGRRAKEASTNAPKINSKKVFIQRPLNGGRRCKNSEEIESRFREAGFEFYSPENYSWEEQINVFSEVEILAGYAGSGTFNVMFTNSIKKLIIIGSDSYTATNEYMISAVKNIEINYLWGDSDIKQGKYFNSRAFMSDYSINYQRDSDFINDMLDT